MTDANLELPKIKLETSQGRKVAIQANIEKGLAVHSCIEGEGWQITHAETGIGLITAIPDRKFAFIFLEKLLSFGDWETLLGWSVADWFEARKLIQSMCNLLSCRAIAINDASDPTQKESSQLLSDVVLSAATELSRLKKETVADSFQWLLENAQSD